MPNGLVELGRDALLANLLPHGEVLVHQVLAPDHRHVEFRDHKLNQATIRIERLANL
jgi:hypothetical protein